MTIVTGTKIGRYEIRSKIGEGGMGEVYLAQDTELERTVALKVLPAGVAADQQRMNRFVREAKAVSALNHPNILTIHETGQADDTRFIATEFIDGETLRQHMGGAQLARISHADKEKPPHHAIKLSVTNNLRTWEAAACNRHSVTGSNSTSKR